MTNDSLRRWLALLPSTIITAVLASSALPACKSTKSQNPSNQPAGDSAGMKADNTSGPSAVASADEAAKQDGNIQFDGATQEARVRQERQQFLVAEYMKKGMDAYNHLDFASARIAFGSAVVLDPSNAQAQEWLQKTLSALGETSASRRGDLLAKADEQAVKAAEALLKVKQSILDGDRQLEQRKFDEAIESYRRAERIVTFYPLLEAEGGLKTTVAKKIDLALTRKDASAREDAETRQRKATADRQMREQQARDQLVNRLRKLYNDANTAFLENRFSDAISNLDQLLEIDPMNERARELRDIVQGAKNEHGINDARELHKKRWVQAFRETDHLLLPQTETIVHDTVYWATNVADRQPLQFRPSDVKVNPEDVAISDRLDNTLFEPQFNNISIQEIATYLNNLTQVNFIVSQKILDMDDGAKAVNLTLPTKTSVKKFLQLLQVVKNFNYRVQDGYVRLITPDENKGQTEYRIYDVSDIVQVIPNYAAPELSLLPPGAPAIPAGSEFEAKAAFTYEQITQTIQNSVAPATWTDTEAKTALRYLEKAGALVVRQTPEVHAQVEKLLNDLREATNLMVEVQTRFLIAEDNFLEDIGFDWRGLGDNGNSGVPPTGGLGAAPPFDDFGASPAPGTPSQPGPLGTGNQPGFNTNTGNVPVVAKTENILDQNLAGSSPLTNTGGMTLQWINLGDRQSELILRAVEKSERVELVTAPRLLVHSSERAHLAVTNQFAYVAGYGVEIAQASSIADPQIDVIQEGAILDVRPVVSADRKFVKLELRPTLATLKQPIEQRVVGVGNGTPVTIQFPNLTIRKVRTTVVVPDGATLLLGGQTIDEIRNESAGVPVLRDLPFIGFFFDRKGQSISKRRLVILLRIKVVIPAEYEPRLPQEPSALLQGSGVLSSR